MPSKQTSLIQNYIFSQHKPLDYFTLGEEYIILVLRET